MSTRRGRSPRTRLTPRQLHRQAKAAASTSSQAEDFSPDEEPLATPPDGWTATQVLEELGEDFSLGRKERFRTWLQARQAGDAEPAGGVLGRGGDGHCGVGRVVEPCRCC